MHIFELWFGPLESLTECQKWMRASAKEQNLTNKGHVCLCVQCRDYEPVFMFLVAQCRLATAHSVSTTPFRPLTHTLRATNHPHGSCFARVPLSAARWKEFPWWETPSFDVKSLEHACSSTKDREREREGENRGESCLTIFHTCQLSKKAEGGREFHSEHREEQS